MSLSESTALANTDQPIIVAELVDDSTFNIFKLSDIRISKTNRKRFNEVALQELAASIKEMGVAQPILIRPVAPTEVDPEGFEIVAGERRYRASIIAGAFTIPAMCRTLTDLQAAKIQILENLQRENPHPLEEAEGYENLMMSHGYNADQLADELKRSRSYIYGRLKLCNLALELREDFLDDKFNHSVALLIARIPTPALQVKAAKEILAPQHNGDTLSYRAAVQIIKNRYMLDLTKATFEIKDAKLLAIAGSCDKCPKRTGNQPEIFPDTDQNICTDPDCFAEKTAAHNVKKLNAANKKGIPVLEGQQATEANNQIIYDRWGNENVDDEATLRYFERVKDNTAPVDTKVIDLLAAKAPAADFAIKLDFGKVKMAYTRAKVQAALEKAGLCYTEQEYAALEQAKDKEKVVDSAQNDAYLERCKKEDEKKQRAEKETSFRVALYKRLRQRSFAGFSLQSLREFVKAIVTDYRNDFSVPDDLLGDLYPFESGDDETVCSYIDQASIEEVQILLVDLILGETLSISQWTIDDAGDEDDQFNTVLAMARAEGIDPDQVRAELETPVEPETAPESVQKPAKRGRKPKTETPADVTLTEENKAAKEAEVVLPKNAPWPYPTSKGAA
ncbi:ParB/RepB/Spo0J family partition protein [Undibacterium sp. Di26W]|uniref:ParB/RepB/Spo0J family partition protein n=1 Tax=Undibacterium sp. Di26W TaxID=3413035 RepID=UPI003BF0735E